MKTIQDTDIFLLTQSQDEDFIHLQWKKKPDSATYRQVFRNILEIIQKDNTSKFLSDLRATGSVSPDDRKWLETDIIPSAIQAGLNKIATVMDEDIFKKYYLNRVSEELTKGGATLKSFDDLQEALKWLNQDGQ